MASRDKGRQRIEPGFGTDRRSGDDLRADPEDRPVAKRKTARKPAKSQRSRSRRARSSGGVFGALRRLVYWSFVLCIWGGIALAGIVVYYGAKMPRRPPGPFPTVRPTSRSSRSTAS